MLKLKPFNIENSRAFLPYMFRVLCSRSLKTASDDTTSQAKIDLDDELPVSKKYIIGNFKEVYY